MTHISFVASIVASAPRVLEHVFRPSFRERGSTLLTYTYVQEQDTCATCTSLAAARAWQRKSQKPYRS